jgi:hypothetical protein
MMHRHDLHEPASEQERDQLKRDHNEELQRDKDTVGKWQSVLGKPVMRSLNE